jgi:hypothetical protein
MDADDAHVAMTMQSLLSPAADMPPHWLWAAMCQTETHALQQIVSSFDQLVSALEEGL